MLVAETEPEVPPPEKLGTKWQQAPIAGASSKSAVLTRELALESASMVRVVRSSRAYDLLYSAVATWRSPR